MMQLGMDGVFVGSGIFKSADPAKRAKAIVRAVTHFNDPKIIAECSEDLGAAMVGINCDDIDKPHKWSMKESVKEPKLPEGFKGQW
jgi:pyridoxal 5'-phosphate synthase pdxS subunit